MAPPLIIRLVMDASGYFKTQESVVASNTEVSASALKMGESFSITAQKQVAAALRGEEALKAQIVAYRELATSAAATADVQRKSAQLAEAAQVRLNRVQGITVLGARRGGSGTAENDINKLSRGVLSGTGLLGSMGRSLAFASSGFLAAAIGADALVKSITGAEGLEKAQASLDVAITHTGGNLDILVPQYTATAKAAAEFGITQADATTGLARATVLTGNAAAAQRAYQEALVISKATGKDFNNTLIATSKGQEGITTSLRRYGILVDSTTSGTQQFSMVMKRFGGQAAANTTSLEQLRAQMSNTLATIGTALLPTVNKLAGGFANWLQKMNDSGKLQKDVAAGMTTIHDVASPLIQSLHDLAGAIGFATDAWKNYDKAASAIPKFFRPPSIPHPSGASISSFFSPLGPLNPLHSEQPAIDALLRIFGSTHAPITQVPAQFLAQLGIRTKDIFSGVSPSPATPFGAARAQPQATGFNLTITEQIAQAQAGLTQSTKDDVSIAKQIIKRTKSFIDKGNYTQKGLLAALGVEGSAMTTLQQAQAAASAKATAAAAKAKALASTFTTSIDLQIAQVQASMTKSTADDERVLKQIIAQARKAEGSKNKQGRLAALQVIAQAQQALQGLAQQTAQAVIPARLSLALARAQALGLDQTPFLLKMKEALERALKKSKGNIQKQTDLWNQIYSINQQLGTNITSALGGFKQASTRALTANLGLTADQRARLRARLSQLGPHGTVPGSGVGAAGYEINPDTGKPIVVNLNVDGQRMAQVTTRHQQKARLRNPAQRRGPHAGMA